MTRPDMNLIEEQFKIFERPCASLSREMADYIYSLEKALVEVSKSLIQSSVYTPSNNNKDSRERCSKCSRFMQFGHEPGCVVASAENYVYELEVVND